MPDDKTTKLARSTLAWSLAIRRIDRLQMMLATVDFGPDGEKFRQPIRDEIARLKGQTS